MKIFRCVVSTFHVVASKVYRPFPFHGMTGPAEGCGHCGGVHDCPNEAHRGSWVETGISRGFTIW
jgi:hypothetical protein